MIPYFQFESISLGFINLNVWGLFVAAGFLAGLLLAIWEGRRLLLKTETILDLAIIVIVSSFVGARLFHVFNEWGYYRNHLTEALRLWEGGLAIYGGVIAAFIAGGLYVWKKNLDFWKYADVIFYSLTLGLAIGRIGCFSVHDHLGQKTSVPWGIVLPDGTIRHETALYEIVFVLLLFLVFTFVRRRAYFAERPGRLTAAFLIAYGLFRFVSDFYRATDLPGSDPIGIFGLHPSQLFSIISIIAGALILLLLKKRSMT